MPPATVDKLAAAVPTVTVFTVVSTHLGATVQVKHMEIVSRFRRHQLFDFDRGDDPSAELQHLQHTPSGKLCAAQPGGETDEVFDT